MKYQLRFLSEAWDEWNELDKSIKIPLARKLEKRLEDPKIASAQLRGKLIGLYKIKLSDSGYRLVYQVLDKEVVVLVISVGRRDKSKVYDLARERIKKAPPR